MFAKGQYIALCCCVNCRCTFVGHWVQNLMQAVVEMISKFRSQCSKGVLTQVLLRFAKPCNEYFTSLCTHFTTGLIAELTQ